MSSFAEDTRFGILQSSFGPRIAVFASPAVNQACQKNNLPHFTDLLRPFEHVERVSVRHSNYSSTIKNSLRLSFFPVERLFEDPSNHTEDAWVKNVLEKQVFRGSNVDEWSQSKSHYPSKTSTNSVPLVNFRIKKDNEWFGSEVEENENYPQPSTPWYNAFLTALLDFRPLVAYDYSSHPLAALIVVSTNDSEPLNQFAKLYEASGRDGKGWPKKEWLDTENVLRYYLLVHEINEEPDGGKAGAAELLESVKRAYGLNCGFLLMNSEHTDWLKKKRLLDRDPHFITNSDDTPKIDHWSKYRVESTDGPEKSQSTCGRLMSEEDVLSLKILLREYTLQSLVPHMERCVQTCNETLAALRKGITGRLFNVGRRYLAMAAPGSGTSSPTLPSGPDRYNPVTRSYPYQSQEAQTRRLADLCFMLGDYKLASSMYEHVRKDAYNDKAWSYCSSVVQMIGICTLLQSSLSQRSKLNVDLQSYLFDHLTTPNSIGHLRMIVIYYEMTKAIGNSHLMSKSLVAAATSYHQLISGLLYEQVAHSAPPRQATLFTIIAAHHYHLANKKWLSVTCFKQLSHPTGWTWIEDYLDTRIGEAALSDSNWRLATEQFWCLVKRRTNNSHVGVETRVAAEGRAPLSLLKSAYQNSDSADLASLNVNLDGIQLVDIERSRVQIPRRELLHRCLLVGDNSVWQKLAAESPGLPLSTVTPSQDNQVIVDETFYLDLAFKNSLDAPLPVTEILVAVKDVQDLKSGARVDPGVVQVQTIENIELLPFELRLLSVKVVCRRADVTFEFATISYKFDATFPCSQKLQRKGKRLQNTLAERLGHVYSTDRSMQVRVRSAAPILELGELDNIATTVYAGECVASAITLRNTGKVKMKHLSCAISHDSFFRIYPSQHPETDIPLYQSNEEFHERSAAEMPNHLFNESSVLLVDELDLEASTKVRLVCRGEGVGEHLTYWLFTFQDDTSGEFLAYCHIQSLIVLPSLDLKPVLRPSFSEGAFYSLSVEIVNAGIPGGVEVFMTATLGSHWTSRLRRTQDSESYFHLSNESCSRSITLEFDLFPWPNASVDSSAITLPRQLEKLLKKEQLDPKDVMSSTTSICMSSTRLTGTQPIKLDSPALLDVIISSHRNLRKQAISSKFTTLDIPMITCIFPLSSSRTVDLLIFWRTEDSSRQGHHYISDLKLGASMDVVGEVLELAHGKAGGIYEESQREQKLLLKQWRASEYGRWDNPIIIDMQVPEEFLNWNFKKNGPFTLKVKFIIKNCSTTQAARYCLNLMDHSGGAKEFSLTSNSNQLTTSPNCWTGKLTHVGFLEQLESFELDCYSWWLGPGIRDISNWQLDSSYLQHGESCQGSSPHWKVFGQMKLISVNAVTMEN